MLIRTLDPDQPVPDEVQYSQDGRWVIRQTGRHSLFSDSQIVAVTVAVIVIVIVAAVEISQ